MNEREIQIYRNLTGAQKLKTASRLYWSARSLKISALKKQYPDWTEAQIRKAVRKLFLYART